MDDVASTVQDDFIDGLLVDFIDESEQLIERLNENLLQLDEWVRAQGSGASERYDDDLMNDMFRSAHSIKGLSSMLGLRDINNLTHKIENVFDAARNEEIYFSPDIVEVIFRSVDVLGEYIGQLRDSGEDEVDAADVLQSIGAVLNEAGGEREVHDQHDAEELFQEASPPPQDEVPAMTETAQPESTIDDYFVDIVDESDISAKYLAIFIDETELSLDTLTETLLAVEYQQGPIGREAVEPLMGTSHRIKGSAACVGLNRVAKLAHFMEDVLQQMLDEGTGLSPQMAETLLKCTDAVRRYVEDLKSGETISDNFHQLAVELLDAGRRTSSEVPPAETPSAPVTELSATEPETDSDPEFDVAPQTTVRTELSSDDVAKIASQARAESSGLVGRVAFQSGLPLVGLKARLVHEKLLHFGEIFHCSPEPETLEDLEEVVHLTFGVVSDTPADEVQRQLRLAGVVDVSVHPYGVARQRDAQPVTTSSASTTQDSAPPAVAAPTSPQSAERTPTAAPTPKATPAPSPPAASSDPGAGRGPDASNRPAATLRVDIERLDQLMNLAGQLVINKARFSRIGDRLKPLTTNKHAGQATANLASALDTISKFAEGTDDPRQLSSNLDSIRMLAQRMSSDLGNVRAVIDQFSQVRGSVLDLYEAVHQLDRVTDGIQQSVMDTRMVPIGPLFGRFRRVVRDMSRSKGRQIQLVIRGEKTELDKRMIDELGDPLIHMVRNAADHGIESPEERVAAGKPAHGTVTLDAFHRGNSIHIQVIDDGRGLDPNRIRAKAIAKGIISEADAERLTTSQVFQLIWEPGFSTAEQVTEISGRGMGMDIVKSKIEELNCAVELDSAAGEGTTLTIKLPLTLAILPSLMAEIDGDVFALPIESVVEIVCVEPTEVKSVHGLPTARIRGRVISVVRLSDLLAWSADARSHAETPNDTTTLVVIGVEGREMGLQVDRVLGEEDVVIKSLAENYQNVLGIAGASILGDGRVSLILDIASLVDMASRPAIAAIDS